MPWRTTRTSMHELSAGVLAEKNRAYKAWWAIKKLNMDLSKAGVKRFLDLNELEEIRNDAYLNSKIAKER